MWKFGERKRDTEVGWRKAYFVIMNAGVYSLAEEDRKKTQNLPPDRRGNRTQGGARVQK